MRKKGYGNRILRMLPVSLCLGSLLLTPACGREEAPEEEIVLIDPVSVAVSSTVAEYRDIYDYVVVSAICCPGLSECVTENSMTFNAYEKTPGEAVEEGEVLISGDSGDLDKQIEAQQKHISEMEESRIDEEEQQKEAVENAKKAYLKTVDELNQVIGQEPGENDASPHDRWEAKYNSYWNASERAELALERAQLSARQSAELYELDHERAQQVLEELYRQKNVKMLTAERSGVVVALGFVNRGSYGADFYYAGDWIGENTVSMALGDTSVKELRCDHLNNSDVNKAEDVYALINGKRYEVQYESMSSEEYERISEKNGKVYSCFHILDGADEIEYGTFATIVMEKEHRKGVLAVPKNTITYESGEAYVYLFDGDSFNEHPVVTGISDGQYTEILSGLKEGDVIKAEFKPAGGSNEAVLAKGKVHSDFSASGFLYYPSAKRIMNPVEYGTVYLDEVCVSRYEQVQAGQVIAKVHVVTDGVDIERARREIQRLNEQLEFWIADGEEDNKYLIKNTRSQIEEKQKNLDKMLNDSGLTEIRADFDGIITEITEKKAGELLNTGYVIGRLADAQSCFVMVEDENGKLAYGSKVTVSYKDDSGQEKTVESMVATVNPLMLDKGLQSGYAVVKLPLEVASEIAGSRQNTQGWWSISRVGVKAELRVVNDVLLVPKRAVKDVSGSTYVTVVEDNGARRTVAFVPGGSDSENYWVITGLSEGMRICWE